MLYLDIETYPSQPSRKAYLTGMNDIIDECKQTINLAQVAYMLDHRISNNQTLLDLLIGFTEKYFSLIFIEIKDFSGNQRSKVKTFQGYRDLWELFKLLKCCFTDW